MGLTFTCTSCSYKNIVLEVLWMTLSMYTCILKKDRRGRGRMVDGFTTNLFNQCMSPLKL
jgi:hypothetical protein